MIAPRVPLDRPWRPIGPPGPRRRRPRPWPGGPSIAAGRICRFLRRRPWPFTLDRLVEILGDEERTFPMGRRAVEFGVVAAVLAGAVEFRKGFDGRIREGLRIGKRAVYYFHPRWRARVDFLLAVAEGDAKEVE